MSINKSLKGKLFAVIFDTEKMIFLVLLLLGLTAKGKNILQTQLCPLSFFFYFLFWCKLFGWSFLNCNNVFEVTKT